MKKTNQFCIVPAQLNNQRLDQVSVILFAEYSRSLLKKWIIAGNLTVNGLNKRPRDKVFTNDQLTVTYSETVQNHSIAENIPLNIIFEDESLIIINKPAGLVVHPAPGHQSGTLQNALLFHCPSLAQIPRSGIIHRLDKETSGLMIITKTLATHNKLTTQLASRSIMRQYCAIICGTMIAGGIVNAPIGRHPVQRKKMAITLSGKPAITHYRISQRYTAHTLLKLKLETGRTHQIRVHMQHIRYPLLGDPIYNGRTIFPPKTNQQLKNLLSNFNRQALHAEKLGFIHPITNQYQIWQSPLPDDMLDLITALQENAQNCL